ncbi:hypothetical protein LCGC14_1629220 [marine sediment metagenome]|uniref:Uncharacterized protein n=1 Tax=marine sediment metagenome TaxID=412755 RepID=A0A0F9KIU6_9ZZZZ
MKEKNLEEGYKMEYKKIIAELKKWLINKEKEYEEIALNSMSDSRAGKYMAKATAMKEVLNRIVEMNINSYCSFYAGGDAKGKCMLHGSNDFDKSLYCKDIDCE